jgi:hypothetical protein
MTDPRTLTFARLEAWANRGQHAFYLKAEAREALTTIRELRAENERLKTAFETAGALSRDQLAESERLRERLQILDKHDHQHGCSREPFGACKCGLWDYIAGQETPNAD